MKLASVLFLCAFLFSQNIRADVPECPPIPSQREIFRLLKERNLKLQAQQKKVEASQFYEEHAKSWQNPDLDLQGVGITPI